MLPLIISLVSGAVGGNVIGALAKNLSLGTLGNSIAGIAGGGLGGSLLGMLGMGGAEAGLAGIISQVAGGGVGGGVLMFAISLIRKVIGK